MYEQIGVHSREMQTKKWSNGNLRSKMTKFTEVMTTDWTVDKISELTANSIEISQTIVQSEKNTKSCIDHYIVGQYEDIQYA